MRNLFTKHTAQPPQIEGLPGHRPLESAETQPPIPANEQRAATTDKPLSHPLTTLPACPYCFRRRNE